MKYKISIVTPTLNGGGAEKVAVNLANQYALDGHAVDLVVLKFIGPYKTMINEKVRVVNLEVDNINFLSSISVLYKIRNYLKNHLDNLVLSVSRDVNIFTGLAAKFLYINNLVFRESNTLHGVIQKKWPKNIIYIFLMKYAYRSTKLVISNSDDTKFDLIKHYVIKNDKTLVIRNPVLPSNYKLLASENIDESWFRNKELKTILSVGRLTKQKNFSFLISVFKDVYKINKNLRLIIIGEGEQKLNLLNQIKFSGLSKSIKIIPFQKNIYPFYKKADLFILTSKWEGFGNVLVEALSAGLPIISSNCPGGPKMILNFGKYGKLLPLNDKPAFVNAILDKIKNSDLQKQSMEYAKYYTVLNVSKEYLKAISKISH